MKKTYTIASALVLLLIYTSHSSGNSLHAPGDPHSYANTHAIQIQHLKLALNADFVHKTLTGSAILTVTAKLSPARTLILDTRDLKISAIYIKSQTDEWKPTPYSLGKTDPVFGTPLTIQLPELPAGNTQTIKIDYQTSPSASGLQWLTPEQTTGKQHPYLFTESQPIHARSWIPLQDTPQIRFTYTAKIHTPKELRALMSADNNPETSADGNYSFSMPQPIPSYLMALAIGNITFKSLGTRTGIYAEPEMLATAAAEFEDTQTMLEAVEKLYGAYRWTRYDLLILPPSFPMGGMENPRLSFITPTILAGDKSLISVIAHELAHSWSGNLVTNASWQDLWLNEGLTNYVENRIMEILYGKDRAAMESLLSYIDLQDSLKRLPADAQKLYRNLQGLNPDEIFGSIPYVKGQMFLTYLEKSYGREVFDKFLQEYFQHFAFQSVRTDQFLSYLKKNLLQKHPGIVNWSSIKEWVYSPGLPKTVPVPTSDAFVNVRKAQTKWLAGEIQTSSIPHQTWSVHEWLHFLDTLPATLTLQQIQELDTAFDLTRSTNNEIEHFWLLIAIRHEYQPAYARLENYLTTIGRGRLVNPLYRALSKTKKGHDLARAIYTKAKAGYHPQVATAVAKTLAQKRL